MSHARPPTCRLVGVSKSFGGVWACRNVDLDITSGQVHALLGENGAGKSTLMKILHGVHAPDEGHIELRGTRQSFGSPRDAQAAGIAMVPQELDLFPDLSVTENLFVGRARPRTRFGGFAWRTMRKQALETFRRLDVVLDVDQPARLLSGAQAQLVEIARALIGDAHVVLFDEPTAALTERETAKLFSVIRGLIARGVAVVYISHRLDEIAEIADRVTVMRDGARIHTGDSSQLDGAALVTLMVGRPLETMFHRTRQQPGEPALEVVELRRRGVFHDVAFTLRHGEVLGMSGLIGAGRSEVAQALYGFAPATGGRILVHGKEVTIATPRDAIRHGIAYVPEERRSQGLLLDFPIGWNMSLACLARLSSFGWIVRSREDVETRKLRGKLDIRGGTLDRPVGTLSGGNQQKVLLSKYLMLEPDIIILDEPTRGVDVGAKAEIYRIIDDLAVAGKAVLIISSELNELLSMADRIVVMHEGRVAATFAAPFSADAVGAAAAGLPVGASSAPRQAVRSHAAP